MIIWVVVRRVLALVIRLLLLNRVVTLGVIGLLVAGLVVYPRAATVLSEGSGSTPATTRAATTSRAVDAGAEVPTGPVQDYIKGMTTFDAKLMWDALSPDVQSKGGSLEKFQQQLDDMKRAGARYEEVSYIGGYPLHDGTRYFFYVMSRRGFAGPNAVDQVYFVFTVGPDGKILKIE